MTREIRFGRMGLGLWQRWGVFMAIALLIGSCSSSEVPGAARPANVNTPVAIASDVSALIADLPQLNGPATAEITVGGRIISLALDGDNAPVTAGNFVDLAQKGVYDGTQFHRVVRSPEPFVAQGGDPQSADPNVPANRYGTGNYVDPETGKPRLIPLEILPAGGDEIVYGQILTDAKIAAAPELTHRQGAVAMARSGVNTASSQFYITLSDVAFLDGSYAVFGYVTDGMDVVDDIQIGDVISSVTVVSGAENLVQP